MTMKLPPGDAAQHAHHAKQRAMRNTPEKAARKARSGTRERARLAKKKRAGTDD